MKFLGRAKKFLQDLGSEPAAKVEYFNVRCASGHRVRGERTEGYQAIRCPACGDGVFVLPRSPLPEPAAPPRTAESRRASAWPGDRFVEEGPVALTDLPNAEVELADRPPAQGEVEIIWDDEPARPAARREATAPAVSPAADRDTADVGEGRHAVAREAEPSESPRRDRPKPSDRPGSPAPGSQPGRDAGPATGSTGRRPRAAARRPESAGDRQPVTRPTAPPVLEPRVAPRRRPRHGLIFALVSLLVVASVGWRLWRQRRMDYPLIAEKGRLEGIPALDAGEFDKAYQLLSAAKTAVDALGGAVEDAEEIRGAADEAAIFVDLCNDKLEDMLAEAARTEPDAWASKFDLVYKGRAYIFETVVTAVPPEGSTDGYEVDYIVVPPGESSRFGEGAAAARPDRFARLDLSGFELFQQARPPLGTVVKFGCRLESLKFDPDRNHWVVRLMPKGGVFMTHSRALEAAGGPVPELIDPQQEGGQP